jgi:hypothetical protein
VLQADGAVRHHRHRLAGRLGIAVRHADRGFLVQAGEELGLGVAAVIDQRFVQAAEARPRVGRDVFEAERLDDVDHEIRARPLDHDVAGQQLLGFALGFGSLRHHRCGGRRRPDSCFKEVASFHGFLLADETGLF